MNALQTDTVYDHVFFASAAAEEQPSHEAAYGVMQPAGHSPSVSTVDWTETTPALDTLKLLNASETCGDARGVSCIPVAVRGGGVV